MFTDEDLLRLNFRYRGVLSFALGGGLALFAFYLHPKSNAWLRYPLYFPWALLLITFLSYLISTIIVKKNNVKRATKMKIARTHHIIAFFLFPILLKGMAYNYLSGLWFLPTAMFILIQMFYAHDKRISRAAIFIPIIAFTIHYVRWFGNYSFNEVPIELMFTLFITVFYYHLSTYFKDINLKNSMKSFSPEAMETFYFQYDLTGREQQLASDILNGFSTREISQRYGITEGTVKNHTQHIYKKMNINSKMKLVDKFLKYYFSSENGA